MRNFKHILSILKLYGSITLNTKFAKDCKILKLQESYTAMHPLDDWLIDVIRVARKKVAMVSHVKSMVTFLIPYLTVGGAINVPLAISNCLKKYLQDHNLHEYIIEANKLFAGNDFTYCKTNTRKIIGHMSDIKFLITGQNINLDVNGLNQIQEYINQVIINFRNNAYERPKDLILSILQNANFKTVE